MIKKLILVIHFPCVAVRMVCFNCRGMYWSWSLQSWGKLLPPRHMKLKLKMICQLEINIPVHTIRPVSVTISINIYCTVYRLHTVYIFSLYITTSLKLRHTALTLQHFSIFFLYVCNGNSSIYFNLPSFFFVGCRGAGAYLPCPLSNSKWSWNRQSLWDKIIRFHSGRQT